MSLFLSSFLPSPFEHPPFLLAFLSSLAFWLEDKRSRENKREGESNRKGRLSIVKD